jgi:hypothetical protein
MVKNSRPQGGSFQTLRVGCKTPQAAAREREIDGQPEKAGGL